YIHHATECGVTSVDSRQIHWAGEPSDERSGELWPTMNSDICLRGRGAPLVIDCKFYGEALKETRHGQTRLSSSNLYQLFTYTQNLSHVAGWEQVEGMLLYAQTGNPFEIAHDVCGRRLRAV